MTGHHRAEFARRGWFVFPDYFRADEVEQMLAWTGEVFARAEPVGSRMVYCESSTGDGTIPLIRRIERFCDGHKGFEKLLRYGRQVGIVELFLGGSALLFKEKINSKFPGGSGYGIHQDQQAGWTAFAPIFITAMICLDEIGTENGGFLIANSRRCPYLLAGGWNNFSDEQVASCEMLDLHLKPGDLLLFDSFVPHGSGPNPSSNVRRALFATYNAADFGDHRTSYFKLKGTSAPPLKAWPESVPLE